MGHIQIFHHSLLVTKYQNISMTYIIGILQLHCKSEHKHVMWNKTTRSIFSYLQSSALFK